MTQMKTGMLPLAGLAAVILVIGSFILANSGLAPLARLFAPTPAVDHGRHLSPDVTQFGYGPLNSASTVSGFDSRTLLRLSAVTLPGADKAVRLMPLLVDRICELLDLGIHPRSPARAPWGGQNSCQRIA